MQYVMQLARANITKFYCDWENHEDLQPSNTTQEVQARTWNFKICLSTLND